MNTKEKMLLNAHPIVDWKVVDKGSDLDLATWKKNDVFYVNFKGSDSIIDWFFNFNFWAKKIPYKRMEKVFYLHRGFINLYQKVRDRIHVEFLDSGASEIFVMGHSLGGALATICYADFRWHKENKREYNNIEVHGFASGSPRVLSHRKGEAQEFERLCLGLNRLVLEGDIVTHVPMKWFGFRHVSRDIEEKFGDKRKLLFSPKAVYQHAREFYVAKIQNPLYKAKIGDRLVLVSYILFGAIYSGLLALIVGLGFWIF